MFQLEFLFPPVISQYLELFISQFCLQMIEDFTTSAKPFLKPFIAFADNSCSVPLFC